jgi:restriction endonuclease Mrr
VFVTSSTFSAGAKKGVEGLQTRIKLIDREELLNLMFKFDAGAPDGEDGDA